MPWKECSVMDERLRFVAKLLDGEAMSGLCRLQRPGAENPATPGQPVRPEVVTYVLGTNRHLCVRSVQLKFGAPGRIRTHDPLVRRGIAQVEHLVIQLLVTLANPISSIFQSQFRHTQFGFVTDSFPRS